MATTYQNTIQFDSEWTLNLLGVWLVYNNSTSGTSMFDLYPINVAPDSADFPTTPLKITSVHGSPDNWTITLLDSAGRLWGTAQAANVNIPDMNGAIQINFITTPGFDIQWAVFNWPDGSSSKLAINRI